MQFSTQDTAIAVTLMAVLTLGALAAVFGVVPATQDRAARNAVAEAVTAQALCASEKSTTGALAFCSREELASTGYLPSASNEEGEDALSITTSGTGTTASYVISVTSKTGKQFQATNERQTPIEVN
ncbi:hypothetical protein [Glutamicibacter arilaitensis]|uniref:hypothetical protein n=1 Tax=Glutamicibacter arilaitensis TaxID=256701 RepID=UPI003FD3E1AB